jgi:hypothetical protein
MMQPRGEEEEIDQETIVEKTLKINIFGKNQTVMVEDGTFVFFFPR